MKAYITIFLILMTSAAAGRNWYVSDFDGNDSDNGQSSGTAWKSITKLNASMGSILGGDFILFNRGDRFYGTLRLTKSGAAGSPITIGAYGTGAKPIISGMTTLTGWHNYGGNIWGCKPSVTLRANVNILTIGGVPFAIGRTPNSSWYTYTKGASNQIITSAIAAGSAVGKELIIRKTRFIAEKAIVTDHIGNTLTFAISSPPMDNNQLFGFRGGTDNYGFFMQRFLASLDQQGEWYFSAVLDTMKIYSTVNPSTLVIKAASVDTVISLRDRQNVIVRDLAIEGGNKYGVCSNLGANVQVRNCDFNNNTRPVYIWNSDDAVVDGNTINNSMNSAILVANQQKLRMTITNNTITNTGMLMGNAVFASNWNLKCILAIGSTTITNDYVIVTGNTLTNTGYMGIEFKGSNVVISRNVIDYYDINIDDGGAIYSYVENTKLNTSVNYVNRRIDSNFISNAVGAPGGTAGSSVDIAGYYMDDQVMNVDGNHNTIYNMNGGNGAQMNNPKGHTFRDNTIYNCTYAINMNMKRYGPLTGNFVRKNVIYQKLATQFNWWHVNQYTAQIPITMTNSLIGMASIDSNWISNRAANSYRFSSSSTTTGFPLTDWQGTYTHDGHQVPPPVTLTDVNTTLYINPSDAPLLVTFANLRKIDPKGVIYDNQATIPRWSSMILINNGNSPSPNPLPVANAGTDIIVTSPTTTATLLGSGTDNGSIAGYAWTLLPGGPGGGALSTPNAQNSNITGLVIGVYQYQLVVSDNQGALSFADQVQVTVNPPANQAPVAVIVTTPATTITLPVNSVTLDGTTSTDDGTISAYHWDKIFGPATFSFGTANASTTTFAGLVQGTYTVSLTVTDNNSVTNTQNVTINVLPAIPPANIAPVSRAGTDQTTQLPTDFVTLDGSASNDPDGGIVTYLWEKTAGPATFTIGTPGNPTTLFFGLVEGDYTVNLTVTDNVGASHTDAVQVHVTAAAGNQSPLASAGGAQEITLPVTQVTLTGAGSDPDGSVSSYGWQQTGGTPATINSPAAATTTVDFTIAGVYEFELTVTDNLGATATSSVTVTVNGEINASPQANAGPNVTLNLPVNFTTLTGSGSDTDGTIANYQWSEGATVLGSGPSLTTLALTGITLGTHTYILTVTDNDGGVGTDTVVVVAAVAVPAISNFLIFFNTKPVN